jgi:RNA polymerase sigma-70 factor, ECF subfamily
MFSEIEACIPALRRYASALLRNGQDVDDLVHDCLIRALDKLPTRRGDEDIRAWLFTIMHNLFVSQRRRASVRPDTESLDEQDGVPTGIPGGQEDAMRWRELMREVNRLPEEQRATILLIALGELSYNEAARVLGVPVGTVMSRLFRARERLRQATTGQMITGQQGGNLRRVK